MSNTGPLKSPLPLFFVDLEPRNNNKEIYQLQFLQYGKIRVQQSRHIRVVAQCTRCQSCGHAKEWLRNVYGANAMATQKSDCAMYTVPKLWPHKRVIAQYTRCQCYGHTKEWLHILHGDKAVATQKSDCTVYTVPKLWPHKRVIAQYTRCQNYGHTKPTAQSPTTVSNAEGHTTLKVAQNLKTPHQHDSYAIGDTLQTT
jgi:hypothetical protein